MVSAAVDVVVEAVLDRPLAEVSAYAADPRHAPEWYRRIDEAEVVTGDPPEARSQVRFVARFLGRRLEYTYEIVEHASGERLVMRTAEGPFPMETTYTWSPVGEARTRMTMRNRGEPSGFSKLAAPLMARAMRRAMTQGPGRPRRPARLVELTTAGSSWDNREMTDLEARLRRLEDLAEINQLFIDYGHHLDHGDFAAYADLFAADGEVLLGPIGRAQGRDQIRALMERTLGGAAGSSYHVISNPMVALDGDNATTDVMWTVVSRGSDGRPVLGMIGRHRDTLVREDGQWRFKRRKGFVDIPSTMPAGEGS